MLRVTNPWFWETTGGFPLQRASNAETVAMSSMVSPRDGWFALKLSYFSFYLLFLFGQLIFLLSTQLCGGEDKTKY